MTLYGEDSIDYATMEEMIEEAKQKVIKACEDGEKRKWLGGVQLCPYVNNLEGGGLELWALEGTPMRGFIVVNYGLHEVMAFDTHHKRLRLKRGYGKLKRG